MRMLATAAAALALALPASAQDETEAAPSPGEIVNAAPQSEWVAIAAEDLLVMTLAPDAEGKEREVIIQLMPPPFSQGWISNIKTLARTKWYDGTSVNRVQDNYVVQWGDPGYDNPESGETETKPLPEGLKVMGEEEYASSVQELSASTRLGMLVSRGEHYRTGNPFSPLPPPPLDKQWDAYAADAGFQAGWPVATALRHIWPTHCYGMVGVGRNYSPDTGSGAELYAVIGHAPRHLDRNIALVGRIISGMEHLSSLPRGSGALGFYTEEEADKRTPILSVRVASDLPEADTASSSEAVGQQRRPRYEYLSSEGPTFAKYAEARANRRDPFFIVPAGGADICNIPVPVREVVAE